MFVSMGAFFLIPFPHFALFVVNHLSFHCISQHCWNDGGKLKKSADSSALDKPEGFCPGPLRIMRSCATAPSWDHSFSTGAQIQRKTNSFTSIEEHVVHY